MFLNLVSQEVLRVKQPKPQPLRVAAYNAEIVHFSALYYLESKQRFNNFYARTYVRYFIYQIRRSANHISAVQDLLLGQRIFLFFGQRP